MRRLVRGLVAPALALVLVACGDDLPSGPGDMDGSVEASVPLGAAVLEVRGDNVTGFEGVGATRLYASPVQRVGTEPGTWRVLLVGEQSGRLAFRVAVADLSGPRPSVVVVLASDAQDQPIETLSDVEARVRR